MWVLMTGVIGIMCGLLVQTVAGVSEAPVFRPNVCCDVWAFIRVKNDLPVFPYMLASIENIISYGVIGLNDCNKETERVASAFVRRNPGFRVMRYNVPLYKSGSMEYFNNSAEAERRLDSFYNYVLSGIPAGSWFVKLDADEVYSRDDLRTFLWRKRRADEMYCYGRIQVYCENGTAFVPRSQPVINPCDHWLLVNTGLRFTMYLRRDTHQAYELLQYSRRLKVQYSDVIGWHFGYMKPHRRVAVTARQAVNVDVAYQTKLCNHKLCSPGPLKSMCTEMVRDMVQLSA